MVTWCHLQRFRQLQSRSKSTKLFENERMTEKTMGRGKKGNSLRMRKNGNSTHTSCTPHTHTKHSWNVSQHLFRFLVYFDFDSVKSIDYDCVCAREFVHGRDREKEKEGDRQRERERLDPSKYGMLFNHNHLSFRLAFLCTFVFFSNAQSAFCFVVLSSVYLPFAECFIRRMAY